ncbi:MAG: hypothetical protein H0T79_14015 [Deltaproteobacteria bacterium]|nr:hypothetical protein [Deltaproteobacteria bacterium]
MRWLALAAFATLLGLAGATSCSINHRSGDYACDKPADCSPDRVCSGGYCISTGQLVDAPVAKIDAERRPDAPAPDVCPPACTSCNAGQLECTIDCSKPGSNCGQAITCPVGWSCEIDCKTDLACRSGVNCLGSTACHVRCSGNGACRNVACGSGPCNVECSGQNSCSQGVTCGHSCECDVSCTGIGLQTCSSQGIPCGDYACDDIVDYGCNSTPAENCSGPCL